MTDKLPHQLLALFAPRPPLRWVPPPDHAPEHRRTAQISGLAQFLPSLNEYKDNDGFVPTESWLQRRDRKAAEHKQEVEQNLVEGPKNCAYTRHPFAWGYLLTITDKPTEDQNIRGDAFKTLIVARLSYEVNEHDLEREFARYGPIERVRTFIYTLYLRASSANTSRFALSRIPMPTKKATRKRSHTEDTHSSFLNARKT